MECAKMEMKPDLLNKSACGMYAVCDKLVLPYIREQSTKFTATHRINKCRSSRLVVLVKQKIFPTCVRS